MRGFQEQVIPDHLCGASFNLTVFLSYRWEYLAWASAPLANYHCGKTPEAKEKLKNMVTKTRELKKTIFYIFTFKSIIFATK